MRSQTAHNPGKGRTKRHHLPRHAGSPLAALGWQQGPARRDNPCRTPRIRRVSSTLPLDLLRALFPTLPAIEQESKFKSIT
ncbi:hypothetical protein KAM369_01970 [Aeromonas caviae]|nr:hypothetical protein KAM369_01970 [Aeromonas caviae]GJC17156.1 hypothetical protein KAM377_06380 [Aeromonas caviae]GJC26538.1 hypothetical protein KAM376D_10330 [Aeromonas caviae]